MIQEDINLEKQRSYFKEMDKEVKRSILYGYESEIDTFADVCKALNKFDFKGLNVLKKEELSEKIKNIQSELSNLLKRIN